LDDSHPARLNFVFRLRSFSRVAHAILSNWVNRQSVVFFRPYFAGSQYSSNKLFAKTRDRIKTLRGAKAPASLPTISSAVVINDNNAAVTTATLAFYLRGIFRDERYVEYALSLLPEYAGLTFDEVESRLEQELLGHIERNGSAECSNMHLALREHREATSLNRRAYLATGRVNPKAVFWPDPSCTDRTYPGAGRSLYTELPIARKIPLIEKTTRVVSAGSCFATEIAHALQKSGYNYLVKEKNKGKPGSYELLGAGELPNSSAAWGIIFNSSSLRQLVEKAFELRTLPKILWTQHHNGRLVYLDPFREDIAFESIEAFEANVPDHLRAAREAFLEMDVFIITLGLNEIWHFKADGSVFSRSPWRIAPSLVSHRILSPQENIDDLVRMAEILRAHNPSVRIICSVSPVPLHATFRADHEHVVAANAHSKAVLRVAAEEFERRCPGVYYFPSFEMVTTSTERPWGPDQRHVSQAAVAGVMTLFHEMFNK
jgi:hypothetical protein